MKQEFVTSTGTVTLERDVLHVQQKINFLYYKTLFQILLAVSFAARFAAAFYEEPVSKRNFEIFLYGIGTLIWLTPLLFQFVTKSYAKRIPLRRIEYYKTEEDVNGLEMHVHLVLPLGRTRTISFRKLENQLDPFLKALATYQVFEQEPQFA